MAGMKWWMVVLVAMSLLKSAVSADGENDGVDEAPPDTPVQETGVEGDGNGVDDGGDADGEGEGRSLFSNADPCSRNPCPPGTQCRSSFGTSYTCDPIYSDPCSPNPCPPGSTCHRNAVVGGYLCDAIHVDPCLGNPCPFGQRCQSTGTGNGYHCVAPPTVDPCHRNPCPVGQTCHRSGGGLAGYVCVPPPTPADPCHPNPCPVGQSCHRSGGGLAGYVCVPPPTPAADPCYPNPCPFGQQCTRGGLSGYHCLAPPTRNPCAVGTCLNGGHCRVLPSQRYHCDCLLGYSGSHCEIAPIPLNPQPRTACFPNPCSNGCQCVESCRHSSGYFCKNDNGYLGKNCTIPPPVVRCDPGLMTVTVDDAFVREYDMTVRNSKLYTALTADSAPGQECYSTFNSIAHSFSIPSPFTKCGTKILREGNTMVVENNIWLNRFTNGQFDMPVPVICYQCRYTTEYTFMTSLTPAVDQPPVLRAQGRILKQGTIELCKVGHTCPNGCPTQFAVAGGAVYTVGELLHIIIRGDNAGNLAVRSLFLSCDGHPGSSVPVVTLVTNGCPATSGNRMPAAVTHSGMSPVACVSFQVPRLRNCARFYIHAQMDACNGVPCSARVCPPLVGRRRREVVDEPEYDYEVGDVFGPIYIWEGGEGVPSTILFPDTSIVNTTAKIMDRPDTNGVELLRRMDNGYREPLPHDEPSPSDSIALGPRPYVYVLIAIAIFVFVFAMALAILALHRHGDSPRGSKLSLFLK